MKSLFGNSMEKEDVTFDCAIIGGGLAGLCLSIQLADQGVSVILFEKNHYPFHKVCGEYVSMESWDFLCGLGVPLANMDLPKINQLGISSEKGFMLNHALKMGGFGISRYSLDHQLSKIAAAKGVAVRQGCKVSSVRKADRNAYHVNGGGIMYSAKIVCGSYGRYAPSFIENSPDHEVTSGINYIGVKYHIRTGLPSHRIELHNFKDGYCGVSKVDKDWYCLCYLTTADNLNRNGKHIKTMEENVLYKNPFLRNYLTCSEFVNSQPMVISNVYFNKKDTDTDGVFLLGDAAGSITPLCGNGMSMGMRASKLLAKELTVFFKHQCTREQALARYRKEWNGAFNTRITAGYYLQHLFGKRNTTDVALRMLDQLPAVTNKLVTMTHGETF